jgi:hypothetical protein
MNPYVGLETFINWKNCGIQRGKILDQKIFDKYVAGKPSEAIIAPTRWEHTMEDGTVKVFYLEPKETARTIVVRHLGCEVKPNELFTSKVITEEVLKELDETVIKKMFMLPNIADLSDIEDMEIADDILENDESDED